MEYFLERKLVVKYLELALFVFYGIIIPLRRLDFLVARKEPVGNVCITVSGWGSYLRSYKLWHSQIGGWK